MQTSQGKRPAARIVLLFVGGILVAQYSSIPLPVVFAVALASLIAGLVLQFALRKSLPASICLHTLVLIAGFLLYSLQSKEIAAERLLPRIPNESVVLHGTIDADPIVRGKSLQFIVKASSIIRESREEVFEKRILTFAARSATSQLKSDLRTGMNVSVEGVVEPPFRARNPGEFDYGRYLELNDIVGVVRTKDSTGIYIEGPSNEFSLTFLVASIRRSLTDIIEAHHSSQPSSFLKGIIIADRGEIPGELKQAFIDTGTIHILAVSGFNVGIVAVVMYALFGLFRIPKKLISAATILGLLVYMLLTGATPSVVRATIMACVFLVGTLLERKTDMYNVLSVSALIILVLDPKQLFNVGFQLSFAAVLSMVYLYPLFADFIKKIPETLQKVKAIDYTIKLFAISLAAQLGTIPFTAFYFERISVVSLLANLVVVPVVSLNVILGFAAIAFSFLSGWLASCYAALNEFLTLFLLRFVTEASKVPFAYFDAVSLGASFPFFYYIGLGGIVHFNKPRVFGKLLILLLFVVNVLLFAGLVNRQENSLTITAIDVGQGDAILIEFPDKKHVLVDAGPRSPTYDSGERIIAPFLRRKGVTSLDAIVLSHPHSDHLGGIQYLLERFQVVRLIRSEFSSNSRLYNELFATAERRGVEVIQAKAGDKLPFDSTARAFVLNPFWTYDSTASLNNSSLVLKVLYGSSVFLLMGDVEAEAERNIVSRYGAMLDCDVLKVGHHGSITSTSDVLLKRIAPTIAIISVGRTNKFGHPSTEIVAELKQQNIEVRRTDEEGAVIVRTDGSQVQIINWR